MADIKIVFPDVEVTYSGFFLLNTRALKNYFGGKYFKVNDGDHLLVVSKDGKIFVTNKNNDNNISDVNVIVNKLDIFNMFNNSVDPEETYLKTTGGRKVSIKKEICGKLRCIYKIPGSRKEHIKYKGRLIAVADYKKLMKKA